MTQKDMEFRDSLAKEAARVRESGDLGRSEPLVKLFDFLLQCSLAGRVPKGIEVAQEVFGKTSDFDEMLDASVRVYIHRLRRKLGEHYARLPHHDCRISIPLGEYRLVLAAAGATGDEAVEPAAADEPAAVTPPLVGARTSWPIRPLWLALIGLALINALGWYYYAQRQMPDSGVIGTAFWRPIVDNRRPTLLVLGDYYIFGETTDNVTISRLTRDFAVNSREDLEHYVVLHPDRARVYRDVNLHYLPIGTGRALRSLLPTVNAAARGSGVRPGVENMSEVKPEILKEANIVYVGFFSGLGALQDPLFRASGFKIGDSFDELVDKTTSRRFKSDWNVVAEGKVPQRDYGYIASLRGPTGNRILIIAGTRDPGIVQMSEVAADQAQLDAIAAKVGDNAFEALFEVRTLGNLNLGSSLVTVRPMRAQSIW
ncbi:helix-turn-helix domain-containing protein [Novosphingobium sp. FKTRR1]|uniref:helix-turn-helix domain-containing protein n=1 Tax=Novosphingobium sp. FKTRR1 TaxID=2879118 RepID=UPI001CF0400A|nr:helix-turn-helix domain-containing protein [Novosphingobium sp. FKTRR1]